MSSNFGGFDPEKMKEIQSKLQAMQQEIDNKYVKGTSRDGTIVLTSQGAYKAYGPGCSVDKKALQEGKQEFIRRLVEALQDLFDNIKKLLQESTMKVMGDGAFGGDTGGSSSSGSIDMNRPVKEDDGSSWT